MRLLRDFELPANTGRIVENESDARAAARELGYPVVLKTAMRGIDHKSDRDGVRLDIEDDGDAHRGLSRSVGSHRRARAGRADGRGARAWRCCSA